jgi:hypothetical protein
VGSARPETPPQPQPGEPPAPHATPATQSPVSDQHETSPVEPQFHFDLQIAPPLALETAPQAPEPEPKSPVLDPRVEEHGLEIETLHKSMHELRDRFMALHDQLHGLVRRFDAMERVTRDARPSSAAASAASGGGDYLGAIARDEILQEIAQLRLEFDQRLLGLTPQTKADMSAYAPLAVVKKISVNFQASVDEFEAQFAAIKDFLKNLVSRNDLEAMMDRLTAPVARSTGETAGGRIRCLLCDRPVGVVTGMITEGDVSRLLGTPPQSQVRTSSGTRCVLAYGKETMTHRPPKRSPARTPLPPIGPPVRFES